jgi:hypothetical protein
MSKSKCQTNAKVQSPNEAQMPNPPNPPRLRVVPTLLKEGRGDYRLILGLRVDLTFELCHLALEVQEGHIDGKRF